MNWTSLDTWIVVIGALSALSCALLGCFLVLRRMSLMGDAISHAVLPGLAIAFLLTGSRSSLAMFIGAALVGVLTALFTQWIHTYGKVEESAAMGVVFTTLFALGLLLIVRAADSVDLDPGCVLYGAVELTPLDTVRVYGAEIPRAALTLGAMLVLNTAVVSLFYKELKVSAFDPALADTLGIPSRAMHYLLMTLVGMTTVASFEAVGSILVLAMLIVPAAAAYLLTDRLLAMLAISLGLAALAAGLGHVAAIGISPLFGLPDTSTAGMMAVAAGALFFAAMLFGPRHGLVSKAIHRFALNLRILREDALGLLYRLEERGAAHLAERAPQLLAEAVGAGGLRARFAMTGLVRRGQAERDGARLRLTDEGRLVARQLVRSHRLWEAFLESRLQAPLERLHEQAHKLEHIHDDPSVDALEHAAGHPVRDPHGQRIPEDFLDLAPGAVVSLSLMRRGMRGEVMDASPEARQQGVRPGVSIAVEDREDDGETWVVRLPDRARARLSHDEADHVQVAIR